MTATANSSTYLLDTSALFALIEDEPGAERVEALLRSERVVVPFLAGLETYYVILQERSEEEADRRLALIRQLPAQWLDHVSDQALIMAGHMKAYHRMSLADAVIAAFAREADAILVHKDPGFESVSHLVRQERLPYKSGAG